MKVIHVLAQLLISFTQALSNPTKLTLHSVIYPPASSIPGTPFMCRNTQLGFEIQHNPCWNGS